MYKFLLILSIFSFLIAGFFHPILSITQDLGRHLLTGQIILETFSVPKINLFSYTNPNFPFINHHWFSEVLFYFVFQISGFNGLLLLTLLLVCLAFALVFFYSLKTTKNILALTIVSVLYLRVLFERTDVRPEIFSLLFLSLFIVILYTYRTRFTRWIFILPFLELLWVNTHIYFPIGIAVIGLFLVEQACILIFKRVRSTKFSHVANSNHMLQSNKTNTWSKAVNNLLSIATRKFSWMNDHKIITLIFIFLTSMLTTFINPNGLAGALYPLHVFQNYGYTIEENQNVFFLWNYFHGKTTILFFFISSIALFLSLILTFRKIRIIDWLLAIFFTTLAVNAERNFPLFVFGTFIPFTNTLSNIFQKWTTIKQFNNRTIVIRHAITILFIFIITLQTKQVIEQKGFGFGVDTGAKNAADFFINNNIKGPIFNNFDIGSYLEYRLYQKSLPAGRQERIFIDGRPEAYPSSFIQGVYIPMQSDKNIFDQGEEKYNLNAIFFSHSDQTPWGISFLKQIVKNPNWKIVYLDDYVVILLKDNDQNKNLIKQFTITYDTFSVLNLPTADINALYRLANFFNISQWHKQEIATYQMLLSRNPDSCPILYNLSVLLYQSGDPGATPIINKFQKACR